MSWCFAIINNKLSEVYFDKKKRKIHFWGHCYVKMSEYKSREERKWIEKDTAKVKLSFKNGVYRDLRSTSSIA